MEALKQRHRQKKWAWLQWMSSSVHFPLLRPLLARLQPNLPHSFPPSLILNIVSLKVHSFHGRFTLLYKCTRSVLNYCFLLYLSSNKARQIWLFLEEHCISGVMTTMVSGLVPLCTFTASKPNIDQFLLFRRDFSWNLLVRTTEKRYQTALTVSYIYLQNSALSDLSCTGVKPNNIAISVIMTNWNINLHWLNPKTLTFQQ